MYSYFRRVTAYSFLLLLFFILLIPYNSYSQKSFIDLNGYSYEVIEGDPLKARIYKLDNGLTVYMTIYKDEPRIQTYIATRVGSKNDPPETTGLAHYLEHMLFKGTNRFGTIDYEKEKVLLDQITSLFETYRETIDKEKRIDIYRTIDSLSNIASEYAIANEYDKMMSLIGAKGTNAYTWFEETVYTNDIPSNQLEKWLTIEAERFRNPIVRLFHTELETVYEEKNISLDDDGDKAWNKLFATLFQNHSYGTQTTLGKVEHLKNPSIKNLYEYYNTYYVPNNMSICLSGDFDMDEAIKLVDEKFGSLESKTIPVFTPPVEELIFRPIIENIYGPGPEAEFIYLAFRFNGASERDADMIYLISNILYNGTAGLIDLNLDQSQKVLSASSFTTILKDYSAHILYGRPREGQSLEEVKELLLSQIKLTKQGKFPEWLLEAIINDLKLEQTQSFENNYSRAIAFVDAFILGIPWEDYIFDIERLSKITKGEIVEFANEKYKDNYVVVNKRIGEDEDIQKVEKPQITPVKVNRENQSDFYEEISNTETQNIEPVFLDYEKDIIKSKLVESIPVLYKENNENDIFYLFYVFDMGTNNNKRLGLAVSYIEYLGTSEYSPSELKQEFFKLGCNFNVSSSSEQTYVSLSGLNENFEKGLALFESILEDAQPNQKALANLINDILKIRKDNKLSQSRILWGGMYNYGKYGPKSPYTNILSVDELKALTTGELVSLIKDLTSFKHKILYYGKENPEKVNEILKKYYKLPSMLKPIPPAEKFQELPTNENKVFIVDYDDMIQAEIILLTKKEKYNKENVPVISLYNDYFGNGMAGIVFQEIRESKALAYSAFSSYGTPSKKENAHYLFSYIGTQADKLPEALSGIIEILNNMPESEITFSSAKDNLLRQIETNRITKSSVLFDYLEAQKLGLEKDIREDIYKEISTMTLDDVKAFQKNYVKDNHYTILVLGDKDKLDISTLEKYGKVKYLTLKEIFGY